MKRLGALVGVVAMVAAALFVRGSFDDDSDAQGVNAGADGAGLLCPSELAEVCREASSDVDSTIAGRTADALIEATSADVLGAEAWVVPAAWARMVVAERTRSGLAPIFDIDDTPLASAPVMIAIWDDRRAELESTCGAVIGWECLARQSADGANGLVLAGMPDVESASGLTVAGAQAAGLLHRSDFARNDFDDQFLTLVTRLAGRQSDDALTTMRLRGPGELTAAGALQLTGRSLDSTFGTIVPFDMAPAVRADIVALVPEGQSLSGSTRDALTAAFANAGWGDPTDSPDGLPNGSVLAAIRTLWNDSR